MKKILLSMAALAMMFTGCTNSDDLTITPAEQEEAEEFIINVNIGREDIENPTTRAIKTDWEVGDKVFLFLNNKHVKSTGDANYMVLTKTADAWSVKSYIGTSVLADDEAKTMTAVYMGHNKVNNPSVANGLINLSFHKGGASNQWATGVVQMATGVNYTMKSAIACFKLEDFTTTMLRPNNMVPLRLTLKGLDTTKGWTLALENQGGTAKKFFKFTLAADGSKLTPVSPSNVVDISKGVAGEVYGGEVSFNFYEKVGATTAYQLYLADSEGNEYKKTISEKTINGATAAKLTVFDENGNLYKGWTQTQGAQASLDGKVKCNDNVYETIAEAVAANPEATEIELFAGEYETPDNLSNLTITGKEGETTTTFRADYYGAAIYRLSNITFKNITFTWEKPSSGTVGFKHAGILNFENCVFNGLLYGHGTRETYTKCTFNNPSDYNMWTYGAYEIIYNNCTFNSPCRYLNVYNVYTNETTCNVTVNGCKFNNLGTKVDKPALFIKTLNSNFNITINDNCTITGPAPTDNGGLWKVKDEGGNATIIVNGVQVYPALPDYVLESDGSYTINTAAGLAYAAANLTKDGGTFNLNNDIDMTGVAYTPAIVTNLNPVTINGNGKTISNLTVTNNSHASLFGKPGADVTINNLTIANSTFSALNADGEDSAGPFFSFLDASRSIVMNGCVADNVTISNAKYAGGLIGYSSSSVQLANCTVKNSSISSAYSEDNGVNYKGHAGGLIGRCGSTFTIDNCSVQGVTFSIQGPRGGIFVGTSAGANVTGTGSVKNNTGLPEGQYIAPGYGTFSATVTVE